MNFGKTYEEVQLTIAYYSMQHTKNLGKNLRQTYTKLMTAFLPS